MVNMTRWPRCPKCYRRLEKGFEAIHVCQPLPSKKRKPKDPNARRTK